MAHNPDYEQLFIEKEEARQRLKRQDQELLENNLEHSVYENWKKLDRGREFFNEFDEVKYEQKARVDMMYYQKLLTNIDESYSGTVSKLLGTLYKDIYGIYEFVNIEPEIYGAYPENVRSVDGGPLKTPKMIPVTEQILNESIDDSNKIITHVITKYIADNFYNLDENKRYKNYFNEHKEDAKKLIAEGVDPEEAMTFSIKTVVMENLLRNIAFPFAAWTRIKYLSEDDKSYGEVFDKEQLVNLIESFNGKLRSIAKIVAIGS